MQSFFPKALLYKEWLQQRWLFVMGIMLLSLSPGLQVLTYSPAGKQYFDDVTLPGLEYLVPIYGIGLAVLSLRELFQGTEAPFVNEPVRRAALLRIKWSVGSIGTIVVQAIVAGWYGLALQGYPVAFPFVMIFGTWLVLVIGTLASYAVAFVICLVIRPTGLGIFFTVVCLLVPYIIADWFRGFWSTKDVSGGTFTHFSPWASHVYTGLQNLSPLAVSNMLPHDLMIGRSAYFYTHNLLPVIWILVSYPLIEYAGRKFSPRPFHEAIHRRRGKILQMLSSLVFAMLADKYFFDAGQITADWERIIAFCAIWLFAHLLLRALLSLGKVDKEEKNLTGGVRR